jgi:2-aminomuconate deaminase
MSEISAIESSKAPEPVGLYPHARRVGNLLFLSGVGPRERGAKKIPGVELDEQGQITSYDIAAQCHSVFRNIRYILEDAGSDWSQIIDVTVYLTNMKDDFPIYNSLAKVASDSYLSGQWACGWLRDHGSEFIDPHSTGFCSHGSSNSFYLFGFLR